MPDLSPTQQAVLEALRKKALSKDDLAEEVGTTSNYAHDSIIELRRHGYDIDYHKSSNTYRLMSEETEYEVNDITRQILIEELSSDGVTYEYLEEEYNVSRTEAYDMLDRLRDDGYSIEHETVDNEGTRLFFIPEEQGRKYLAGTGDGTYKFALMGDTHLGSSAEHLNELHDFYDEIAERGIDTVFHAGDITDGYRIHRGQINVLKGEAIGWGRLLDYTVDNYPRRQGVDTFFIEGNHDNPYYKDNGVHLGQLIDNQRSDLHYMGDSMAEFVFDPTNDISMELIHPSGGKPYTPGYRLMTLYRERPANERPSLSGVGHLHGSMYNKAEGVRGFYVGCWKGLTTWGKKKGHNSDIGGWIVELKIRDGKIRSMWQEFIEYEANNSTNRWNVEDLG